MTPDRILEILIVGLTGIVFGLVGKIIWDWLKGNREMETTSQKAIGECPKHQGLVDKQNEHTQRIVRLETLFEENSKSISADLERGRKLFDKIESSITEVKEKLSDLKTGG